MKKMKMAALLMTLVVTVSGLAFMPEQAKASETTETKVIYEENVTVTKDAPTRDGYVFGGWYKGNGTEAYTEETIKGVTTAYAKWVPAYVLSVKAQNEKDIAKNDNKKNTLRIITSVDSRDYQNVGFDVYLNNKENKLLHNHGDMKTANVYSKLAAGDGEMTASQVFGSASGYFGVWWLSDIEDKYDASIIYVKPYWTTLDGTKVYGLGKYVHVEDGYEGYISVPINLRSVTDVAAGIVTMTSSTALEFVGFEAGRVLKEMACSVSAGTTTDTIKIVGNADTVDTYADGEEIFANVRFRKTDSAEKLTFNMKTGMFCDWDEKEVENVKALDYQY